MMNKTTTKKAYLFYGGRSWEAIKEQVVKGGSKVVTIPSSQLVTDHRVYFNEVEPSTEVVIIADCPPDFDYEFMFHFIDNGLYVEKQGKEPYYQTGVTMVFHSWVLPEYNLRSNSFSHRFKVIHCLYPPDEIQKEPEQLQDNDLVVGDIIVVRFESISIKYRLIGINKSNKLYACSNGVSVKNIAFDYFSKNGVFVRSGRWLDSIHF